MAVDRAAVALADPEGKDVGKMIFPRPNGTLGRCMPEAHGAPSPT
jgi:hypothetical protein